MTEENGEAGMTISEASERIGVSAVWVWHLCKKGRLRVIETGVGRGRHKIVAVEDVERERERRLARVDAQRRRLGVKNGG